MVSGQARLRLICLECASGAFLWRQLRGVLIAAEIVAVLVPGLLNRPDF